MLFMLEWKLLDEQSGQKGPNAVQGILDLKEWNFEQDGNVRLNGQWEFYEKQLLTPEDFMPGTGRSALKGFVKVAGQWTGKSVQGAKWNGQDYGTVRLKVRMPQSSEGIYGIKTSNIRTAHQLFRSTYNKKAGGFAWRSITCSIPT